MIRFNFVNFFRFFGDILVENVVDLINYFWDLMLLMVCVFECIDSGLRGLNRIIVES